MDCMNIFLVSLMTYPLWMAARGSLLLLMLMVTTVNTRKNMLIPKHTRYTAL